MNLSIKELNELIYSLGITALNGKMLDKELNQSLMEKLHAELAYKMSLNVEDELSENEEWLENRLSEDSFPHYVTNEEADEDYRISMMQDEQRYEDSHKRTSTTQRLLDYVDEKGAVTYGELHKYYKYITGSNSFSHMLKALRTPYKNRLTQRYIVKEGKRYSDAKYIIKLANPSNWVVNEYDNDFKTFNEAPYGND